MKTFLVFVAGIVASGLAAIIAASLTSLFLMVLLDKLTSRGAFLSRGDVVDIILGPISVGGPIGGWRRLGKRLWTAGPWCDCVLSCSHVLF